MNIGNHSSDFLKSAPHQPTHKQILEMVKKVENELELKLHRKRDRLKIQLANEAEKYRQEIDEKYQIQRESEVNEQRRNMERLRMHREQDRQKYIETKQLQQQIRDSEELRLKWSKKLLDECAQSRRQQIEEKLGQESFILAMEKASLEEQRQQQQMELQKLRDEAEQMRHQMQWDARQEFDKQLAIKRERKMLRKNEEEHERKLQQQTDEAVKKFDEKVGNAKKYGVQQQKEFLRYQIEQHRGMEKVQRQQEIDLAKAEIERIEKDTKIEAESIAQTKRIKNVEILQFNDYMQRARLDKEKIQMGRMDLPQATRVNEQLEANAEAERQKNRQLLNAAQRGEYLQNFNEKRTERMRETEMEFYEMKETQKQNVMYEEMMAQKRHQHRLQFKHDLDQQIKLKNLENARNMELEMQHNQKMEQIHCATNTINEKLLLNDDGIEGLLPEHPFYNCLTSKFE